MCNVFEKSWKSYRKYVWFCDELVLVSGEGKMIFGGWVVILVDVLDIFWIMGFYDEFLFVVIVVV